MSSLGSVIQSVFGGTAVSLRIKSYRENSGAIKGERTIEKLITWAAEQGVAVPEYIKIIPLPEKCPPTLGGQRVQGKYFECRERLASDRIWWCNPREPLMSIVSRVHNAVALNIDASILKNDEEFLHVIAHEIHEITNLKRHLEPTGDAGRSVADVYSLIAATPTLDNLHSAAWEYADSLIETLRGMR